MHRKAPPPRAAAATPTGGVSLARLAEIKAGIGEPATDRESLTLRVWQNACSTLAANLKADLPYNAEATEIVERKAPADLRPTLENMTAREIVETWHRITFRRTTSVRNPARNHSRGTSRAPRAVRTRTTSRAAAASSSSGRPGRPDDDPSHEPSSRPEAVQPHGPGLPPTPCQQAIRDVGAALERLAEQATPREQALTLDILRRRIRNEQDCVARTAETRVAA